MTKACATTWGGSGSAATGLSTRSRAFPAARRRASRSPSSWRGARIFSCWTEPTNDLDIDMRHALTVALQGFEGGVVFVSHDRHLIRAVADTLWLVADGKLAVFDGDLYDYQRWMKERSKAEPAEEPRPKESARPPRADLWKLRRELELIERKIAAVAAEQSGLDAEAGCSTTVATPSITSPSPGIRSPASQTTTSPERSVEELAASIAPEAVMRFASASVFVLRKSDRPALYRALPPWPRQNSRTAR